MPDPARDGGVHRGHDLPLDVVAPLVAFNGFDTRGHAEAIGRSRRGTALDPIVIIVAEFALAIVRRDHMRGIRDGMHLANADVVGEGSQGEQHRVLRAQAMQAPGCRDDRRLGSRAALEAADDEDGGILRHAEKHALLGEDRTGVDVLEEDDEFAFARHGHARRIAQADAEVDALRLQDGEVADGIGIDRGQQFGPEDSVHHGVMAAHQGNPMSGRQSAPAEVAQRARENGRIGCAPRVAFVDLADEGTPAH